MDLFAKRMELIQWKDKEDTVLSLIPSFSLPDVLCGPTDLIWRKGTSFEAMTGRIAPSSDGLLAEIRQMSGDLCIDPRIISLSPFSLATDVTDATLGASGLWLQTRTGASATATLTESSFGRSPSLHGQKVLS